MNGARRFFLTCTECSQGPQLLQSRNRKCLPWLHLMQSRTVECGFHDCTNCIPLRIYQGGLAFTGFENGKSRKNGS